MRSMTSKGTDKTFISINMTDDLKDRLNTLAKSCGRSRSKMCRYIFEDYMKVYEKRHGQI